MIRHILSKYSEKNESNRKKIIGEIPGKTTYETSTIEISDPDEFFDSGSTLETRTKESSDPDEFILGPTDITKSIEATDSDEFVFGPTVLTENVELSDPDEFVTAGPTKGTFSSEC